jgi:serine/threonine-protein kinase
MWHGLALLVFCLATWGTRRADVLSPWPYLGLWTVGIWSWAAVFWTLRRRSGPVTFVERQLVHVWGGSMIACAMVFIIEMLLGFPPLTLSPVIAAINGTVFFIKAGLLSGRFYLQAAALYARAFVLAFRPVDGLVGFAIVSALSFFLPGLRIHRTRLRKRSG